MNYRICTKCVMDTSDERISFDDKGVCNHCRRVLSLELVKRKRKTSAFSSKNIFSKYDCIIGLSGGIDSCYLLHWAVENGLKPLAVHYDSGWNSELSQKNIELLVNKANVDLVTEVADWESMRQIQLAFLRSGVTNCDIPQDHAFVSVLYKYAIRYRVFNILTGHNSSTESILPTEWGYTSRDSIYFKSILTSQGFSWRNLNYPLTASWRLFLYSKVIPFKFPLEEIAYEKNNAKKVLENVYGWKDYGGKHMESMFTSFFQSVYLPEKFNFDKRRAHLSSMIISGQVTREEALNQLNFSPVDEMRRKELIDYVCKKLNISLSEMKEILSRENRRTLNDFKYNPLIKIIRERKYHSR